MCQQGESNDHGGRYAQRNSRRQWDAKGVVKNLPEAARIPPEMGFPLVT